MFLDEWKNDVPKLRSLFKFVHCDVMETVHYLSVSHVLAVLLIYEDNVVSVLGAHERKVDLVVYE